MPDDPASSATTRQLARQLAEDHYYAALDLVLEGHHEQAVEEYRQAVAADPKFTDALHGLSRALQDLNRFDEAIEAAKQISEIDPDDILAHTSVEEVLLRLLETQEEQDRWLLENREAINAKIRRGIEQLERGEGIPRRPIGLTSGET